METIQIRVSAELARQLRPYARQLPQILELGLRQLEQQQNEQDKVSQTLAQTGFIQHLAAEEIDEPDAPRQPPPVLPGPPASEILIAQRRGER
jgi:hypothetical protein